MDMILERYTESSLQVPDLGKLQKKQTMRDHEVLIQTRTGNQKNTTGTASREQLFLFVQNKECALLPPTPPEPLWQFSVNWSQQQAGFTIFKLSLSLWIAVTLGVTAISDDGWEVPKLPQTNAIYHCTSNFPKHTRRTQERWGRKMDYLEEISFGPTAPILGHLTDVLWSLSGHRLHCPSPHLTSSWRHHSCDNMILYAAPPHILLLPKPGKA